MVYLMDHCCSQMSPNVDQLIMVYDVGGAGWANMEVEICKRIISVS